MSSNTSEILSEKSSDKESESESELISRAQFAVSQCNWVVGECASSWTKRYAKGRTDSDFGQLVGLSGDQVYQRRRVWETFGDVRENYASLKWSHFYISLNWDDAPECLQWAEENQATIAELKTWRRALVGTDVEDESPPDPWGGDPNISFVPTTPVPVKDVEDSPSDPAERNSVSGETAGKDLSETAYTPFRSNAGTAPDSNPTANSSEEVEMEQLIKRITTTLERIGKALTPDVMENLGEIPESLYHRFQQSLETLHEKTGHLVT